MSFTYLPELIAALALIASTALPAVIAARRAGRTEAGMTRQSDGRTILSLVSEAVSLARDNANALRRLERRVDRLERPVADPDGADH